MRPYGFPVVDNCCKVCAKRARTKGKRSARSEKRRARATAAGAVSEHLDGVVWPGTTQLIDDDD